LIAFRTIKIAKLSLG